MSIGSFTNEMQARLKADYAQKHPDDAAARLGLNATGVERYIAPGNYDDTADHFGTFFGCMRTRQQPTENAVFGYRAAGAALLSLLSIERGDVVHWDPEAMKLKS